ncbi:MAG: glycosyltransferase family 4 protein [Deltaproteobacteria bacterium]|nr:glycosyltransferase family 4 protein [Deltaproteobacteria bacterium]
MNSRHPLSVAHVTAESGFSGGEAQLFLLMEGLRKRGHRNLLLCPPGSRSEQEARRRGLEATAVHARNHWSPRGVMSIARRLRETAPDLVHLHSGRATWLGGIAAWRLGLPGLTTRRMDRRLKRNWRTRFVYGTAVCRAVAISEAVAQCLAGGGVRDEIIRVVPSAVEPDRIQPQKARHVVRQSLGIEPDTACLLVAAALVRRKGIDVLLDALALLAEDELFPTLWVAGEGPQRGALERLARDRGVASQVRFLGRRDDVADLLGACDIFVLPSRHEGLGVAALEAMALARPVVATHVGGLGEAVLHQRTGLLVPPDDASALRAALARLLREPLLRERLGAAGPARIAKRYHAEAMVEAYERLYFEVLEERARA